MESDKGRSFADPNKGLCEDAWGPARGRELAFGFRERNVTNLERSSTINERRHYPGFVDHLTTQARASKRSSASVRYRQFSEQ